ncbi:hypothetical protein RJ640_013407, partial [Escallonia rubra]
KKTSANKRTERWLDPRRTIAVRYATATSTSPAKPIAPTGFAVIVFYKFGIMDQLFSHVHALYVVVR